LDGIATPGRLPSLPAIVFIPCSGTGCEPGEYDAEWLPRDCPRCGVISIIIGHGRRLCPLHRDTRPSFYVNRRKQVFYCHGCGCGGGLSRLARLLGDSADPWPGPASEQLLEDTYGFYQRSLVRSESALAYLAARGIHDRALIERTGIGYAPGACLRRHLGRLGYIRQELTASGLIDGQGRDRFFRRLTFPLTEAAICTTARRPAACTVIVFCRVPKAGFMAGLRPLRFHA